jgi:hypothetical protein
MKKLTTYEGIVENGCVRLPSSVGLPENTRVYVFVPETEDFSAPSVVSPHLVHPEQLKDFEKQIVEDTTDAHV